MTETQTIGDIIGNQQLQRFVGRDDTLDVFHRRIGQGDVSEGERWFILNVHGQAGVGKSTLLSRIENDATEEGIPATGLDADNLESIGAAISSIHEELAEFDPEAFEEYERMEEHLRSIENKISQQIENGEDEDGPSGLESAAAQAAGGVAGLFVGGGAGSAIGAGAGELLAEQFSPSKLRRVMQSLELDPEEIRQYSNALSLLTTNLVAGINDLAEKNRNVVLTFDTYEEVTPSVDEWIRDEFIRNLSANVVLVFAGRNRLTSMEGWGVFKTGIKEVELGNFTEDETIAFWRERGVHDEDKIREIYRITNGHPLLNDTIADIVNSEAEQLGMEGLLQNEKSMKSLKRLLERFMDEAPENTTTVLRTCAVARSFEEELLNQVSGLDDEEDFEQITNLSFVFRNITGRFQVHDLAREALIEDFASKSPQKYRKRHQEVAEYLRNLRENGAGYDGLIADEIYHRLSADEEQGLEFARTLFRLFKQQGSSLTMDILLSEMAEYEYETVDGSLWGQFAQAHICHVQGKWEEAQSSLPSIQKVPDDDTELESWVQELQTTLLIGQGKYSEAFGIQQDQTERLIGEITDGDEPFEEGDVSDEHVHIVAESYSRLIELCAILSRFEEGEKYVRDAKTLVGYDKTARAKILLGETSLHRLQGKTEEGIQAAEEAIHIYRELGDRRQEVHAEIQLARLETHDGQWVQAEERLDGALPESDGEVDEELISQYDQANVYLFKGNIHRRRRNWGKALSLYDRALEIHKEMESFREIGPLYGSIGLVYTHKGAFDRAAHYLVDSLRIKQNQEYERGVGITRKYLGDLHLSRGDLEAAETEYERAKEIGDRLSIEYLSQWARVGLGWVYARQLDIDQVEAVLADEHFQPSRYDDLEGKRQVLLGVVRHLCRESSGETAVRQGLLSCLRYNPYVAYATVEDVGKWLLNANEETLALTSDDCQEVRDLLEVAVNDHGVAKLESDKRKAEEVSDNMPRLREVIDDV